VVGGHHTELRGSRRRVRSSRATADLHSVIDTLRKIADDQVISRSLNPIGMRTERGATGPRSACRSFEGVRNADEERQVTQQDQADSHRLRPRRRRGCLARIFRAGWRTCLAGTVLYGLAVLIGLIPVNRGFHNAETGIEVFVYADQAHSEIFVPADTAAVDWRQRFPARDFGSFDERSDYVAFGWGDRDFYIQTERWSDIKLGTTLKAMLVPTRTVMHVHWCHRPHDSVRCRRVVLTVQQYERLSRHIWTSFQTDAGGRPAPIKNAAYGKNDAFYRARGRYFFLNTCNNWTGRGLKRAGVRTGLWTPFAMGVLRVAEDAESQ